MGGRRGCILGKYFQILFFSHPHPWPMRALHRLVAMGCAASEAKGGWCAATCVGAPAAPPIGGRYSQDKSLTHALLALALAWGTYVTLYLVAIYLGETYFKFLHLIYSPIISYFNYHFVGLKMYYMT